MGIKLGKNWKSVLLKAWSVRFILLAGILSGVEVFLSASQWILPIPTGIFAALLGLTTMAALISRLVAQKSLSDND